VIERQKSMESTNDLQSKNRNIDLSIRILLIVGLFAWCGMIALPFLTPVLWGIILAITLHPLYSRLLKLMRGKKGLSSAITTALMLVILILPAVWLISSVVTSAGQFITSLDGHTLAIPPPQPSIADWPVIGKPVYGAWLLVTTNIEAAITQYSDEIIMVGESFLGAFGTVASSFVMLVLSIVISGVLLASSEDSEKWSAVLASKIAGERGGDFIDLIVLTIRNVARGILGVALLQFILAGAVLIAAKVPFAGLWALFVLLLAIVQLPAGLVGIPVMVYLYATREPLPATIWSGLLVVVTLSDNVLRPWLMGRGAPVPMLVIFLGAIGGMIVSGFIGLFTGAVILSLGYRLATIWLWGDTETEEPRSADLSAR
jgi:predicted PurR-regulated permease PerM